MMSGDVTAKLYAAALGSLAYFTVDDAFISGVLREKVIFAILHLIIERFVIYTKPSLQENVLEALTWSTCGYVAFICISITGAQIITSWILRSSSYILNYY